MLDALASRRRSASAHLRAAFVAVSIGATALCGVGLTSDAHAQPGSPSLNANAPTAKEPQGVAVLNGGATRDETFNLARAVYASSLRPRVLDELRARVLAGDPPPAAAMKDVRDLAELRASVATAMSDGKINDASNRRVLGSIAKDLGVAGILVVTSSKKTESESPDASSPSPSSGSSSTWGTTEDDAGTTATISNGSSSSSTVVARLFLVGSESFDAARYEPDAAGSAGWQSTVASISPRFPAPKSEARPPTPAAPKLASEPQNNKPFYASPWLWGALGAAVLIGGFFYFASQDTSDDPIRVQMRVPR